MAEVEFDGPITTIQDLDSPLCPIKIQKQNRWAVKTLTTEVSHFQYLLRAPGQNPIAFDE